MVWLIIIIIIIIYFKLSCLSTLHLTSYILPALCASSPLAVSTVRVFIGISQYFSLASVSFISMLLTCFSPVIQVTEDVYTGGNSGGGLWHYYALHHAQSLIAITNQIGGNKLPVDMKLQALIVFNVRLSTDTLRIQVFWNAMLQCWVNGSWHSRVDRQGSWTVTASFQMLGATHPMAERHIPEVVIPQQLHCENLKSHDDKLYSDVFVWYVWN